MSAESEIISVILSTITGDTGSGGFANTSSNAYCRTVYRHDDPDGDRTLSNWPQLYVEVPNVSAMDAFGSGVYQCEIRFHIKTDQDTNFVNHDAVVDRVRSKFHRQTLAAGTDYGFSSTRIIGISRLPQINNKELHTIVNARLIARTNSGV
jgi:hypothetical protein